MPSPLAVSSLSDFYLGIPSPLSDPTFAGPLCGSGKLIQSGSG
jgi:hypothetical protein